VAIGIAVVPMMLAAGVALDYVHASVLKTRLQSALDAAALAAAAASQDMNDAERIGLAESVFIKNWEAKETKDIKATPAFTVEDGAVLGSAEIEVPTALMRIVGVDHPEQPQGGSRAGARLFAVDDRNVGR
jgi:Flp pilus assembly protein TadG